MSEAFAPAYFNRPAHAALDQSTTADRADVGEVLVEVKDLEDADGWPATDTIWIVTSMSQSQLRAIVPQRMRPDDWLNYPPDHAIERIHTPVGMRAFAMWYD